MSLDVLTSLFIFGLVTSITPGPNNLMLLASGVNFGFARTIPHMLGIAFGFCSLLLAVGLGLGSLLKAWPTLDLALKIAGSAYLLYLAWKIATSRTLSDGREASARPMRFHEAAAFQWVNPKAWVMAVTAMALYSDPLNPYASVVLVAVAFTLTNLPAVSCWAAFGVALRQFLADPVRLKWFNIAMGVLLALTLVGMLR